MSTILVVDDSAMDRRLAESILVGMPAVVRFARNGQEAIASIKEVMPDVVVTDIQMPEMDGFGLVEQARKQFPSLPVILMTAFGSEQTAVRALQHGAASFVHKDRLASELIETVQNILAVSIHPEPDGDRLGSMRQAETQFELTPTLRDLDNVIAHVQDELRRLGVCDEADMVRIGTALHEAITNATEHGNLELPSSIREEDPNKFRTLVAQRSRQLPYCRRRVIVRAQLTRDEAKITVIDEGPGFDPSTLPDPTDPENIGKVSGRGVFLIRTFMDEVHFNTNGNEITMIKRRSSRSDEPGSA